MKYTIALFSLLAQLKPAWQNILVIKKILSILKAEPSKFIIQLIVSICVWNFWKLDFYRFHLKEMCYFSELKWSKLHIWNHQAFALVPFFNPFQETNYITIHGVGIHVYPSIYTTVYMTKHVLISVGIVSGENSLNCYKSSDWLGTYSTQLPSNKWANTAPDAASE